ncbi:MAG: ATP-binding protein [Anaerolineales bacterium]
MHAASGRIRRFLLSFRFRLTLLFVAILALIVVIFSVFIYTRQVQALHAETENRLSAQSAQLVTYYTSIILRAFEEEHEEHANIIPQENLPLLQESEILVIVGSDGAVVRQQGALQRSDLAMLIDKWSKNPGSVQPVAYTLSGVDPRGNPVQQDYLFAITPIRSEERWSGTLILGYPVDARDQLNRLGIALGLGSGLLILFAFGGGYWLADRAMKPVQMITHTARKISESDLTQRLHLNRADELGELADTFDQMLDRLQAAFNRQRQFTADASHELRSPLAIIELEADRALERTRTQQEYEKALRVIQAENEWMGRLVNDLLLLARMDSGQIALHKERLDVSEITVDVVERLSPLAESKQIELKTGELAEIYVQADRVYLTQMLTNLVENAIKYSSGENPQVLLETTRQVEQNLEWALICVVDNGPGIPAEHLPHIFDRFYRVDPARSRPSDQEQDDIIGSGLGLGIAKTIVDAYGGTIEVDSEVGRGTKITVKLPAAD